MIRPTCRVAAMAMLLACALVAPAVAETYEAPLDTRADAAAMFTAQPRAQPIGDKVRITFAVSAATDVEVAVLSADGEVVRHLAAGLLGKNAPAPLTRNALKQRLRWDGKDDLGKAAVGGPFKVRVRIGAMPRPQKVLGHHGNTLDPIVGLTCSDTGELYVLMRSWVSRGRSEMRVLDRDGKYVRTIMPYSAKTPAERTKSVGHLTVDGQRIPVVFTGHGHNLSPLTAGIKTQTMAWNPKGHLVVVSTGGTAFEHGLPRHLLAFAPEGGAPKGMQFVGPEIRIPGGMMYGAGRSTWPYFDHAACSADGKYVYYVPSDFNSRHCVYRLQWGENKGSGIEAAWLGEDFHPGADDGHFNDPQGLDVDPAGRIFVCDRGNNRVMVFNAAGKLAGKFSVPAPEQIQVHPRTGAIYIVSRRRRRGGIPKDIGPLSMSQYRAWRKRQAERVVRWGKAKPAKLLKYSAFSADAPPKLLIESSAKIKLFALDPTSKPAKLWASIGYDLVAITDKGDEFEAGETVGSGAGLVYPGAIVADPKRNRVLVQGLSSKYSVRSIDLETGEKRRFLKEVSEVAMAPDGTLIGTGKYQSNKLLRFAPDGKPAPWPGTESNAVQIRPFRSLGLGLGQRGMRIANNGDIYLLRHSVEKGVQSRVDIYGSDGKLKKAALIDGMGIGDCGLGLDAARNVYVGANVKPKDSRIPKDFQGIVPATDWLCWAQWKWHYRPQPWHFMMRNEYLYHWGSVFKFGSDGGAFYGRGQRTGRSEAGMDKVAYVENAPAGGPQYRSGYLYHKVTVAGAKWRYPGMGIIPASERFWGDPSCCCMVSRLATDPYGRTFLPNVFRFCVEMIDTNGNRILRVGKYGNADDVASPADRDPYFAWPAFVDTAEGKLYVSDSVNRRVTVVDFDYADSAVCEVAK